MIRPKKVVVNEQYQKGYSYVLSEQCGSNFASDFKPDLTPEQMLALGVFGGNYFYQVPDEFPREWFKDVRLSSTEAHSEWNYFKVNASQPLSVWQQKGWIYFEDPKGWFLWYCRYYMGRRIATEDQRQIRRWKAMTRHINQLKLHCPVGQQDCQPRRRQALLHWAYDSRKL